MAFEIEQAVLAESQAKRVECRWYAALNARILIRRFDRQRGGTDESCQRFLDTYASVGNYPTPSLYVTDPEADGNTYSGTWKHSRTLTGKVRRETGEIQGVVQVLVQITTGARAGYAAERSTLQDADEYLYLMLGDPAAAPEDVQGSIYAAENTLDLETGSYSGRLRHRYSTPYSALFDAVRTYFDASTEAIYRNQRTILSAPPGPVRGGVYRADSTINQDGTYDGRLVYAAEPSRSFAFRNEATMFRRGDSLVYERWPVPIEVPAAFSGSGLYQAQSTLTAGGTYDGRLVYTAGTNQGAVTFESRHSTLVDVLSTLYRDWASKVDAPSAVQGTLYEAANTLKDDGTYDARLDRQTSAAASAAVRSQAAMYLDGNSILYRNWRSQIEVPTGIAAGGLYRADSTINQDGTYNGELLYLARSPAHAAFTSERGSLAYQTTDLYQDWASKVDPPETAIQGQIYHAANTLTERGTFDARLVCRTDQPQAVYVPFESRYGTAGLWMYLNWPYVPQAEGEGGFLPANRHNTFNVTMTDSGCYNVTGVSRIGSTGATVPDLWNNEYYTWSYMKDDGTTMYVDVYHCHSQGQCEDVLTNVPPAQYLRYGTAIGYHGPNRWTVKRIRSA